MAVAERLGTDALHQKWNQLYADYYSLVLKTARQQVRTQADAEDAAQKTFMDAYEILARGQDIADWEAMIVTIAKRTAGKERSRAERDTELGTAHPVEDRQAQDSAERKQEFQQAFLALSEGEQRAVYYTLVEGLTAAQVGERLGTGADSAAHLLSRGRADLALEIVARNDATAQAITCDRPLKVVCRYLANRMTSAERAEFKSHLKGCPRCRLTVERVREFRGFVLLLLPAGLALAPRDELFARIQAQPVAARISDGRRINRALVGGSLLLLLLIGTFVITHRPTPAAPAIVVAACPTGRLGGFAYLDDGKVMYRSSPQAPAQLLDGSGGADALLWTPDGATLIYKDAANLGSVAGSIHAVHPGGTPFWSFGGDIESFAISPDGASIAALAQRYDSTGTWDGWTLYIVPLGGKLIAHTESALVIPGGPGWRDSPSGEPYADANFAPNPANYWGVFWLGSAIYIAQSGEFASFDDSGNQTSSGWSALSPSLQAMIATIGQPPGSAVHFEQRGVDITATCGSATQAIVAGPDFTQDSSNTLMLEDDPANARAGLAVESYSGATGGDVYLVTADGQAIALTSDHTSYAPRWQP
jgi:RNA polymerase sigma factor (sigma-70 family)